MKPRLPKIRLTKDVSFIGYNKSLPAGTEYATKRINSKYAYVDTPEGLEVCIPRNSFEELGKRRKTK